MTLGRYVRFRRKQMRLTQVDLARAAGVTQGTVSRLERHDWAGTAATVRAIARALDCDLSIELVPKPRETP